MPTKLTVSSSVIEQVARRLFDAERTVTATGPPSEEHTGLSIDDAYAIQTAGRTMRVDHGRRLVGHKIGLTSKPMQEMIGVDQPDYGYLLDDMVADDGAHVDARALIAPRVEGEIAFELKNDLGGADTTAEEVLAATDRIAVAMEVIDSRVADWRITIVDTIADNASSARAVIGELVPLGDLDLAALVMRMRVGDEELEGRGDAVLGHPATSVAWLVRALHDQGEQLHAGDLVLSGALARAVPVTPGVQALAEIAALGNVTASF